MAATPSDYWDALEQNLLNFFHKWENKDTPAQSLATTMRCVCIFFSFFSLFSFHSFPLIRIRQLVGRKEANWKTRVALKFSPESIYSAELIRTGGDNGASTLKHLGE